MQALPHHYAVSCSGTDDGDVILSTPGASDLASAPPAEFDGPGDRWSPEALLVASVADCFVLTFRAIARASNLPWKNLQCDVQGVLDREDRVMRFTEFKVSARLQIAEDIDPARAERIMQKAEQGCLITNSLSAKVHLVTEITSVPA